MGKHFGKWVQKLFEFVSMSAKFHRCSLLTDDIIVSGCCHGNAKALAGWIWRVWGGGGGEDDKQRGLSNCIWNSDIWMPGSHLDWSALRVRVCLCVCADAVLLFWWLSILYSLVQTWPTSGAKAEERISVCVEMTDWEAAEQHRPESRWTAWTNSWRGHLLDLIHTNFWSLLTLSYLYFFSLGVQNCKKFDPKRFLFSLYPEEHKH